MIAAAVTAAVSILLSKLFPGKKQIEDKSTEQPQDTQEQPPQDPKISALLKEGEMAVKEMRRLQQSISDTDVKQKIEELISVTQKIFNDIEDDPADYSQIKRFASYFLPTTIKLLNTYDRMSYQEIRGENISGTMERIDAILDKTIEAYKKQLDALFANQALDIETDITVLKGMLQREGLYGSDFPPIDKNDNGKD